jgi:hypothetical protein
MKALKLFNDIKAVQTLEKANSSSEMVKLKTPDYLPYCLFGLLVLSWPLLQRMVTGTDESTGFIDPNIWLLILLSQISLLITLGMSWWLLQRFWLSMGLPGFGSMVLRFETLQAWEQLKFALCLFALLLLAGIGCMLAVL